MHNTFLLGLIFGIIAFFQMVFDLSNLPVRQPLFSGVIAGLLVGDLKVGLEIGATTQLLSLGLFSFGGAAIPDLNVGALIGVVFAKSTGSIQSGLLIAIPVGILMTQLDIIGRSSTTIFLHGAENALKRNDIKGFERWHLAGVIPWGLSRGLPVFLAIWLGKDVIVKMIEAFPPSVMSAIGLAGAMLPAIGFALLLTYMDLKKYWAFLLCGFSAYAFLTIPILGLALFGIAISFIYVTTKYERSGE